LIVITIIGIPGSLRKDSFNLRLLQAAQSMTPQHCRIEIESLDDIPLYNADVERAAGIPPAVERLKDRIAATDGLLIASPEYNNSLPGVLKNAIDWLSRPPQDQARVFRGRPVAIIGATPSRMGTAFSQTAWLPVLRTLGTRPWFGRSLYVAAAHQVFDQYGIIQDDALSDRLRDFVAGFAAYTAGENWFS
jgi:NAD(P)H-dependent FMN reductase